MTRYKWNLHWSLAVVSALAIGCACWGLAGGCATPGGGGGNGNETEEPGDGGGNGNGAEELAISEATCEPLDDEGLEFEIRVRAVSSQGRELSYTRRVIVPRDQDAGFQTETEVTSDGELVMSVQTLGDQTGVEVNVEYGPLVPGVATASASAVVEDGVLSGMVDGRAIVPMPLDDEFDASAASFEDGDPPPELGMDPDLEEALTELFEAAAVAAEGCQAQNGDAEAKATTLTAKPEQDHGHDSDPEASVVCLTCWGGCSTGFGTCTGIAAAACAAAGPFYALCFAPAEASCAIAYAVCQNCCYNCGEEPPCCPVDCGSVACCDSGEICLNAQIGLCCSPGKTPCVGESCCGSTEVCIDSGPNAGTCCEPEDICGNTCCDPTDSCDPDISLCCPAGEFICGSTCCVATDSCIENISLCCPAGEPPCDDKCCASGEECLGGGLCCKPVNICGSVCCDDLDSCVESLSLCCGFNTPACGSNCCPENEICLGGTTCCPAEQACGSVCCPENQGCDPQTYQCASCPDPNEKYCSESGGCCPIFSVCTPVAGLCCDVGEIYCCKGGCGCKPPGECIW